MSHIPEQSAADSLAKGLLEVRRLKARYGPIEVLHGLALSVDKGQLVSLVGANGAGKTTLLRVLSGVHPASEGTVMFGGQDISRVSSHARVSLGICQAPEGRQVFGPMSVEDNLLLGAYRRRNAQLSERMEQVYLLFPVLKEKRRLLAGTLSGGQQQMLAIGRALMGEPQLLLLDEPSLGLAPLFVAEILQVIDRLREQGMTILLVEQNARAALAMADFGYVVETGRIVKSGSGRELLGSDDVRRAYLGM
ncbi:ABC transporter ATP-binding protein [Bradyrhizobium diazoefficiens]|jgi:branched-chain amino acid transport system ATP-binding protein|uniref:ABC transporter ATP-binding protein n=1 Tax=Bradyrhizobium sp. TaxID=376 RepID=UPI001B89DE91|nr:ABC transporter ATP-binding protein [Bradyrhizobium diazoefficiens]MBR0965796.1 ABC transporter ATP-binding protein [Bradyrhizobium diazoefficiens]MBR0975907.1 ABC transporter ATP-binding protein [Bradyrhizobium diazoefficiens]MBR1008803.1 ABC transporter ATP-binding protein [Bradyrhizobium diazoefficiens]MBR1015073.1 ABC transporter ATP-binding protein [Bradyrhizobium diazoefficiens]MBR1052746.1 ABC transporter ATP-binding protein [Bradyrhizobium diazoefficiens]